MIVLRGEHDLATAPSLQQALGDACSTGPTIVDLTDVEFIDSSAIALLVAQRGPTDTMLEWSRLAIIMPAEQRVWAVLELVGLSDLLPIFASVSDAMEATVTARRSLE